MPASKKETAAAKAAAAEPADAQTAEEKKGELEPADVEVPEVDPETEVQAGPAPADELELSDALSDNTDLGTKTPEEVWPEGATPAGVPEYLPLYPGEEVTDTKTYGDVTWWHTDADRWLTTKGANAGMTTVVLQGPDEETPDAATQAEHNEQMAELQAENVAAGEEAIAERDAELSAEANKAREERNAERAAAQAEQQEKVDEELKTAVVALEAREKEEVA